MNNNNQQDLKRLVITYFVAFLTLLAVIAINGGAL